MIHAIPPKTLILTYMHQYLVNRDDISDAKTYTDSIINDCLTELVKLQMRDIAGNPEQLWPLQKSQNLLEEAITQIYTDFNEDMFQLRQLMGDYEESIRTKLKHVAKEMDTLYKKLQNARQNGDISERQIFHSLRFNDLEVAFELISIGSPQNLDGLFIRPLMQDRFRLNIEAISDIAVVRGNWFPYEIISQELVFVIDDDGTLFISTENFPDSLLKTASQIIQQLARQIYAPIDDHTSR